MGELEQAQYVAIGIEKEKYAVNIQDIFEIIKMQDITKIPNAPAHLKGVINLRGRIIPVISLRERFGLDDINETKDTRIVVVNYDSEMVGIIVDYVSQVVSFSNVQPPVDSLGNHHGSFFLGIGHSEEELISILNLGAVLEQQAVM